MSPPKAYLITVSCYGQHLPGDDGTIQAGQACHGQPALPSKPELLMYAQAKLAHPAMHLRTDPARNAVLDSVLEACLFRKWELLAAHVRTTHFHVVIQASVEPEKILLTLKAYATRKLRQTNSGFEIEPLWARHGSTRYLWEPHQIEAAVHYVIHEQGEPMARYQKNPDPCDACRDVHGWKHG